MMHTRGKIPKAWPTIPRTDKVRFGHEQRTSSDNANPCSRLSPNVSFEGIALSIYLAMQGPPTEQRLAIDDFFCC